jgi:perosamine synthetase
MVKPIPVNSFNLDGNEKKYLNECIDSGWISGEGPFIEKFETQFSSYIARSFGIAVSNGSAALDIAVKALGITKGDEVILPTFTIISPVLSVLRAGAIPVLVDSDPVTWNMDVNEIEAKITSRTKAIIVVHIYGLPAQMNEIVSLAKKHNLKIIEDAAEMHGQTYFNKKCGSFGDISTFSFYANKIITTGEGGMILCDDPDIAARCKKLRNLAFDPALPRFVHEEMGWNYRITNMQAALGVAQLEQIDKFIARKQLIGKVYNDELAFLTDKGFKLPVASTDYASNIYWVFGVVAPDETEKNKVVDFLSAKKIGTRPFFWCLHEQPVLKSLNLFANQTFPIAEGLARRGFYLPSGLGLTAEEMKIVTSSVREYYG